MSTTIKILKDMFVDFQQSSHKKFVDVFELTSHLEIQSKWIILKSRVVKKIIIINQTIHKYKKVLVFNCDRFYCDFYCILLIDNKNF